MRRRLVRGAAQHDFERLSRGADLIAVQRLERGTPLDPGTMRRQQRLERLIRLAPHHTGDLAREPIAAAWHGFEAGPAVGRVANQPAQRGHDLLEAVVGDGDVFPRGRDQRVLGHDRAGAGQQMLQHADMPVADRHALTVARQLLRPGVELKRSERVNGAGRHERILSLDSWLVARDSRD